MAGFVVIKYCNDALMMNEKLGSHSEVNNINVWVKFMLTWTSGLLNITSVQKLLQTLQYARMIIYTYTNKFWIVCFLNTNQSEWSLVVIALTVTSVLPPCLLTFMQIV